MKECSRFDFCDIPQCPLDSECSARIRYIGERLCPYLDYGGKRLRIPKKLKELVPDVNKLLFVEPEAWSAPKSPPELESQKPTVLLQPKLASKYLTV